MRREKYIDTDYTLCGASEMTVYVGWRVANEGCHMLLCRVRPPASSACTWVECIHAVELELGVRLEGNRTLT